MTDRNELINDIAELKAKKRQTTGSSERGGTMGKRSVG